MFLPIGRMLHADFDGHFLLHLLWPHYLNLFHPNGYGLIDKLFPLQVALNPYMGLLINCFIV